ncbi:MAG: tetratricopeptide repeat protein, partial [Planctomycetota bacterium]|nr:tetratricopeptide repeat protein [Planctomycetota bacterium]
MPHPHHPSSAWAVRVLLTICVFLIAASPDDEIARLIEQLGDRNWKSREEAASELLEMGNRVLEPLREALDHPDAEIRLRAEKLIRKLSWRFTGELGEKVKDLFENYESLDVDERGFVVGQVTSRLGIEGIDILLHIAKEDEEAQIRAMALRSASRLGGEELQETILEALAGEEDFWAYRWIAFLRKERGETDLSLEASRKAILRNAHDQDLNVLYIQHLMDKELMDEATGSLKKMTEADPKNPLYRILLVQAYERTGRDEAATRELEEAVEMDPEDVAAYRLLIRECIRLEKYEIANRFIKKSKEGFPGDLPIQGLRAQILEAQEKWDQAFRVYRFLYQTGDSGKADGKTWKEKITEIMERRGEGDLVTDRLLGQMKEAAIPVGLWRELGEIFRAKGLPDLAAIEYRRVLVFKRKDLDLLIDLSEVHHERGDPDGAAGAATWALQFEDILPGPRSRLEAIRDRKAPGVPPPAMAPVIWTWSAVEDEAWPRTPDRDDFPWQIPPISAGGTVVSAVYGTDSVVGLDTATGRLKWRLDPPEPPVVPGPRVALLDLTWIAEAEGRVYLLYNIWHSLPGKFRVSKRKAGLLGIAVDPEAGEVVALFELDASIDGPPGNTGPGGQLAYPHGRGLSGGGNVVLLDLQKGKVAWNRRFRRLGEHSPQILGDLAWVTLQPGLV